MESKQIRLEEVSTSGISRRAVVKGLGLAGLSLPFAGRAIAEDAGTLRWWSPQASPDQLKMYK